MFGSGRGEPEVIGAVPARPPGYHHIRIPTLANTAVVARERLAYVRKGTADAKIKAGELMTGFTAEDTQVPAPPVPIVPVAPVVVPASVPVPAQP